VRASAPALEALVARLVQAGVGVREVSPVLAPLEAAFLALTEGQDDDDPASAGPDAEEAR